MVGMNDELTIWLFLWVFTMVITAEIYHRIKMPNAGLVMSYLWLLSLNHFFGGLIYTFPWYETENYNEVYIGFVQSAYGVVSYGIGAALIAPALIRTFKIRWIQGRTYIPNMDLPLMYILFGIFFYIVLSPFIYKIPSVGTFVQSGWSLLISGLCLLCWKSWNYEKKRKIMRWLLLALFFPFFTTFRLGFLGFGANALITCLVFVTSFYKPRWKLFLIGAVCVYMGLSVFVTYFRDREEIRATVWDDQSSTKERMAQFTNLVTTFEFLNPMDDTHLKSLDMRLNQNALVGAGVENLVSGNVKFAQGETIRDAILALVPRAIWPDKPVQAGSTDYVTRFTGILFAEGTSIGVGQVLEFYINFGTVGVVCGFIILGMTIAFFDIAAGYRLQKGDWQGFTYWFLPGLGLIQAGGSLVEVTSTVAASIVFCVLLNRYMLPRFSGRLLAWHKPKKEIL
jgi:hypothetical protein